MSIIRRPGPPPEDASRPRLGEQGQVFITIAAAQSYAECRRLRPEEARRELTELLLDAREGSTPGAYRARSRVSQIDISAKVVREGRLLVVVSASAREYR